jgi:sugar lactone lactonase YvrE
MAEVFATGIQMGESPRWHDHRFWMCDWTAGEVLVTDRGCFSCMLGGDDGRRLYIVANHWSEGGASDGVVLVHPVAVRHAGRP